MAFRKIQKVVLLFIFFTVSKSFSLPAWVTSEADAYSKLKSELSHKSGDFLKRTVRRLGNNTIELEGFASISGSLPVFSRVAGDLPGYRNWALEGINQKPTGGNYHLKILDLRTVSNPPNRLLAKFGLTFPGIHHTFERAFTINNFSNPQSSTVTCESVPTSHSLLSSLVGFITAFPDPKHQERLWVYFKGKAQLTSWILYQALPEKLLSTESSQRIQTVLDNYGNEEVRKLTAESNRIKAPKKKWKN